MTLFLYAYLVPSPNPPFITVQRVTLDETAPPKIVKSLPGFWATIASSSSADAATAAKHLGATLKADADAGWLLRALSPAQRERLGVD